jgi:hypothetical protein
MKRVLTESHLQTYVHIKNVNYRKYYGMSYNGGKAFLTRKYYSSEPNGVFIWRCVDGVNLGNGIMADGYKSVADAIDNCGSCDDIEVFEFDTAKELFKWLAQD